MKIIKPSWTQTHTGKQFFPLAPTVDSIDIESIAHGLSNINRYCGQAPFPYSVAQHSVLVSYECDREDAFWGLMHDASEAYINDIVSPLKKHLSAYIKIESNLMSVICEKYGMDPRQPASVHKADLTVLAAESEVLFPKKPIEWQLPYPPASCKIIRMSWQQAKKAFLARFHELQPKR